MITKAYVIQECWYEFDDTYWASELSKRAVEPLKIFMGDGAEQTAQEYCDSLNSSVNWNNPDRISYEVIEVEAYINV